MDAGQRATQDAFLAALLAALTPKDTFNLAACDVDCDWVFEKPVAGDADEHRRGPRSSWPSASSLGWTDLDKAFASALKQCGAEDARRLRRRRHRHHRRRRPGRVRQAAAAAATTGKAGTFHAVAARQQLRAGRAQGDRLARRRLGAARSPASRARTAVALELLGEIAQPALRDVKVEFTGLRTARVYPEQLPNVPAGTQQILLGRYLPEGKDQAGEVIVTGTLGGKPVRFTAHVVAQGRRAGQLVHPAAVGAHAPRQAARTGHVRRRSRTRSSRCREEYQIITPYTSLLVLETDADRERFEVKRRFQMRDGEKFFAEGRDNANFELTQKQMKRAGNWRLGLRRSVLRQLGGLGRDPRLFRAALTEYREHFISTEEATDGDSSARVLPDTGLSLLAEVRPESWRSGFLACASAGYCRTTRRCRKEGELVDKLRNPSESGVDEFDSKRDDGNQTRARREE